MLITGRLRSAVHKWSLSELGLWCVARESWTGRNDAWSSALVSLRKRCQDQTWLVTYYTSRDECGSRHTEHTVYHGNARTMCLMATEKGKERRAVLEPDVSRAHVRSDGAQGAPVACEATAA